MQIAADHTAYVGYDIKSLSDAGANTFEGNICLTSINAPCAPVGPSLTASPNPIPVAAAATLGSTTITWNAPDAQAVEIHVGRPDGPLFALGGNRGSAQTGPWVSDGLAFYLQNVTDGKPLDSDHTLATLVVRIQRSGAAWFHLPGGPGRWGFGSLAVLIGLVFCRPLRKRVSLALGAAAVMGGAGLVLSAQPAPAKPDRNLDRMIAGGAGSRELARYVFDTRGCRNCHTMGHDGKLGFTPKGKELAQGFEGCVNMLTAMTVIVQVPADKRSPQQSQKAKRFEEFGCTACHAVAPGKLGMTEIGAKLAHLHLGCVEVEKLVAGGPGTPR